MKAEEGEIEEVGDRVEIFPDLAGESADEAVLRLVIGIIQDHEHELSDGFGHYGGQDGVERTAREIVAALKPNAEGHFRPEAQRRDVK